MLEVRTSESSLLAVNRLPRLMLLQIPANCNGVSVRKIGGFGPADCAAWPKAVRRLNEVEIRVWRP